MSRSFRKSKRTIRRKQKSWEDDNDEYGYQGKPQGDDYVDYGIGVKALKGMPKSSYSVQADPYTAALPGSEPYPIINKFNRIIGGFYGGDKNLDGGNVQQYANSLRSKFLNAFDFCKLKLGINYHYIPMHGITDVVGEYPGKELIDEQIRAIDEATSTLQTTTFTQMAIYDYSVATDMPMGHQNTGTLQEYTPSGSSSSYPQYDDLGNVIYSSTRYYQSFWLQVLGIIDWHNSFRLKMGTMIRSAYNREVPKLNSLFGLFKKKSFLSLINSLSKSLSGEYIDREFGLQFAKTCLIPSRRANALTEPVLEVQPTYNMPDRFILLARSGNGSDTVLEPVFDSATDLYVKVPGLKQPKSFRAAVETLMDKLSCESVMAWARSDTSTGDNEYYNEVKANLDVIQRCVSVVKKAFTDVREVLDTCARTGLVTWYKGFRPSIVKDDDSGLFRNMIVDDIYKLALSGAQDIILDSDTKRFRTFTMWNMYDGIPEYDTFSGGAFLSFSLKNVTANTTDGDPDLIINKIPQCLTIYQDDQYPTVTMVNRKGNEYKIPAKPYILSQYVGTRRLVPLASQDKLQARIPTITPVAQPTMDQANDYAFMLRTLTQICGLCALQLTDTIIYQDPDLLSAYQIEIEDITNEMINYARKNAPFLGAVAADSKIGFLGTIRAGSKTTKLAEKLEN